MKYSRGRMIALTILSVTMVLALFASGFILNYRNLNSRATNTDAFISDPNYIPTFDDLYERIPFDSSNTGTVNLGQSTTLTLLEERYTRDSLTSFLNANSPDASSRASFTAFRNSQIYGKDGYSYPIFSNTDMRSIATGLGNNLEIPVVMLDPYHYDDIVLLELTNLTDMPSDITITRDGVTLANNIYQDDAKFSADQVYRGIPNQSSLGGETIEDVIYDTDGSTVLLNVICTPDTNTVNGYTTEIKDAANQHLFALDGTEIKNIGDGTTLLYADNGAYLYRVVQTDKTIMVYDARNGVTNESEQKLLGTVQYTDIQFTDYKIGAVAYNSNALRGMFREQGFYQIMFKQKVPMGDGVFTQIDVAIAFVIVNKANYTNFPRFNTQNRVPGNSEIYNYSYESEYPTVKYSSDFFDVTVQSTEKPLENDPLYAQRELQFYRIGEYHMTSKLRYYSEFLARSDFAKRGVENGYVSLKRYRAYSSILNILGFQAYYGGAYDPVDYPESKNGQLPFYDSQDANKSSDISAWVRDAKMTAAESGSVVDYSNMRVSDALTYSTELANYISTSGLKPVRTNFPPVKLCSNVGHATGVGTNGEVAAVLSCVAFRAANGVGTTSEWVSSTLEVGAPFEAAGQYLVTVYFKVNGEICQQTFFFEIVNAAKIAFEVTTDNEAEPKIYYVGDLTLNQTLQGQTIKISYDGNTELGQFEVPPTVTLAYAEFGSYDYQNLGISMGENGAFAFVLQQGQYRLTIKYGAHGQSTSVFNIVVDKTLATGIKANTTAKALTLPDVNAAIVGAGAVNLTWNQKTSGINYSNVLCEFYAMELENGGTDPNADRNYNLMRTAITNLYAADAFAKSSSKPDNGYQPIKTDDGWTLKESFEKAGLYRFIFIDDVGNETFFVLIIDDSTPTFVQSVQSSIDTNAVNFNEREGVKIGFGTQKLIANQSVNNAMITEYGQDKTFEKLTNAGILVNERRGIKGVNQTAIRIDLSKIEYSQAGAMYRDIKDVFPREEINNGYVVLKEEGTYYFRVTDVLGNVGEYYIILTHDNCLGMVYAESNYVDILTDSDHLNRGMIAQAPTVSTSFVTNTGGMTNRPYVTFSFQQRSEANGADFRVERIVMQYYPLTYETMSREDPTQPNPNYPFAEEPENNPYDEDGNKIFNSQDNDGVLYQYDEIDKVGGTIRLALFNTNTTTPSGMYILTRTYEVYSATGGDTEKRDYYFIVDDQKMLYYADGENPYQTALKVHFADTKNAQYPQAKDADAAVFHEYGNVLSSNRTAWVTGFNSKYSWQHDSTTYTIKNFNDLADLGDNEDTHNFTFPSLAPRFSYINNHQTTYLGEGYHTWSLGDPATRTSSPDYQLVVADNARNLSHVLVNGNMYELKTDPNAPTSANYDYLFLKLDTGYGAKAEIVVSDHETIRASQMEYDGNNYVYVVDPSQIEQLKFCFENDPKSMNVDVNLDATVASWQANGFAQSLAFELPTPVNNRYTFDLMEGFLQGQVISNGASLSVSLLTYDDTCTNYTILFDTRKPNYNLGSIKEGDNLARTMNASEIPGDYVYGLSETFVFESDRNNNPYLDAKVITYREVDSVGEGTQPAVPFKLYTGAAGETRIPFAKLVGLRDNEMKYYCISETDYAGHTTSYKVQIQGRNYVNAITFIGARSEYEGTNTQIGVEMHASSSSVHQFFLRNHSFKFESGDEYYTVLGSTASWHIGDDIGTGSASEENLIKALNNWINVATEKGTKCSYTLYDRIGEKEIFEFYNIRENAAQIQLDCYQTNLSSNIIMATVTNYDDLPLILFDDNLSSLFRMKVEDKTVPDASTEGYFSLNGTQIQSNVAHELVITVTDPFGRTSITEYHQQSQSTINFEVYGNTITENGVLYIGDERGVNFSYLSTVYKVLIYDAGTGELLTDLQSYISNNVIYYSFVPKKESTTVEQYYIVATGRASGAILFEQTFVFDTRLPSVEWKNASDQTIDVEGQTFVGSVIFDISKNLIPTAFPVTVSYTRTLDGNVERVTLRPGTQKYTFDQEGVYEVTLRNTVWAKKTFKFEIVQIDDTLVVVYDDDKPIQASASDYKFIPDRNQPNNYTYIPRYVFTTTESIDSAKPISDYQAHGLRFQVGQTNRVLAGNTTEGTDYYYYDELNRTLVWRLAFLTSENNGVPVYISPIYFATTGVTQGELNSGTAISLRLNGNPVGSGNNFIVSPSTTTYHEINNNFMEAHDHKVEVTLHWEGGLCDAFGAPCYLVEGNLIVVDCLYNGQLVKTLHYDTNAKAFEVFTINQYDAGFYEFIVHDLVGNYLYFGSNRNDKNDILYRQERYLLAVMTKPLVLINNKQPINGMVYNDQVELKLVDYGNEFLAKRYASELEKDKDFFRSHFCITKMEVQYTGSNGTSNDEITVNGSQTAFYWNRSGNYRVRLTYSLGANISDTLQAEYQFQIIPAYTIRESFSMPIYPDIKVVSVTRDGYKIHDFDNLKVSDNMQFNANDNPGNYVITLKTYNTILQDYITHVIQFNIRKKANSASNYFILSSGSGTSTIGEVALYYNPYWLYLAQGDITIHLYKDFVEQAVVTVDQSALTSGNYDTLELFNVSDAGLYTVRAVDSEGDLVYGNSWTIEEKQSTFGYIILAVVLGIAGIGILVFLRLRRKMTTK